MLTYKDQKHSKNEPETYYRGEAPILLSQAEVDVASDYTKKKHVFRFKLTTGAEWLFQAKEDGEMDRWIEAIKASIDSTGPQAAGPSRSQTMPARGSDEKKGGDEGKKKGSGGKEGGLFTLKKK